MKSRKQRTGRRKHRWLRRLFMVLMVPVLLLLSAWFWLQSGSGRRWLVERANGLLTDVGGQQIRLDGLEGRIPFDMRLRQVTVEDARGRWLELRGVRLAWPWRALVERRVVVDVLSAEQIHCRRRPVLPEATPSAGPASTGRPGLPTVVLREASIGQLTLDEGVLGRALSVSIAAGGSLFDKPDAFDLRLALGGDVEARLATSGFWRLDGGIEAMVLEGTVAPLELGDWPVGGTLSVSDGAWQGGAARAQVAVGGMLRGQGVTGEVAVAWQAGAWSLTNLQAAAIGIRVEGHAAGDGTAARARVGLDTGDLGELAKLLGITIEGGARVQLAGELIDGRVALQGHGALTELATPWGQADGVETEVDMVVSNGWQEGVFDVALRGHGALTELVTPWGQAADVAAEVDVVFSNGWPVGAFDVAVQDVRYGAYQVATGRMTLAGHPLDGEITLAAVGDVVTNTSVVLAGHLRIEPGHYQLAGQHADVTFGPLAAQIEQPFGLAYSNGTAVVQQLVASMFGGRVALDAAVGGGGVTGRVAAAEIDLARLNELELLTGIQLGGRAEGELECRWDGRAPQLTGRAQVEDVRVVSAGGVAMVTGMTARVSCRPVTMESGDVNGRSEATEIDVAAVGYQPTPMEASLSGWVAAADEGWHGSIRQFSGAYGDIRADSHTPVTWRVASNGWEVSGCRIGFSSGIVELAASVWDEWAEITGSVTNVSVATLPLPGVGSLNGLISGGVTLQGALQDPQVQLHGRLAGLGSRLDQYDDLPPLNASFSAATSNRQVVVSGRAETGPGGYAGLDASIPATISLWSLVPAVRTNETTRVRIHSDLDLSVLGLLDMFADARVAGRLKADVEYLGQADSRRLNGTCMLEGGAFEFFPLGCVIEGVNIALHSDGRRLVLEEATATDGGEGRLTLEGELSVASGTGLVYRASMNARDMLLIRHPALTATTSGALTLSGRGSRAEVGGTIDVGQVLVLLNELQPALPPVLVDDSERPEPAPPKQKQVKAKSPGHLNVDIAIKAPGTVFVRSADLDSVWGADFHLLNQSDGWRLTGAAKPMRGTFTVLSRKFRIVDGAVTFDGLLPVAPMVRVEAVYTRPELAATVTVQGNVDSLQLKLSSTPAMPEDEVIAKVLFGSNMDDISPLQMLEVARAASGLGQGRGVDFMDRAQSRLGVDQLGFRESSTGGAGETEIAAGKYLSQRAYVEVSQSLSSGGGARVLLEYQISPHLTVETDSGTGLRPGFGISWRRDY